MESRSIHPEGSRSSAETGSHATAEDPTMTATRDDVARIVLSVICILLLIAGSLWVLLPFVASTLWATMIVVATWPLLETLQARFRGRRRPAVMVMTVGLLLLLVIPIGAAIYTVAGYGDEVVRALRRVVDTGLPPPPDWVAKIPLVGVRLSERLAEWAEAGPEALRAAVGPYLSHAVRWLMQKAGNLGLTTVQLVLVVVVAAVLYSGGESAARGVRRFGRRLAGDRGDEIVVLAGQAIRSVALGVGVTAVVQTVLGALGLVVAGVPFAALLTALMLLFCIAQLGPGLILFPAAGWLYWKGATGTATLLLVWGVLVGATDYVLRPVLIRRGADLPLLLILSGVIGGMLMFGLIGIFIGPVVLAVTYRLLGSWLSEGETAAAAKP
jgi:predicted PurR-regulated permease PerM